MDIQVLQDMRILKDSSKYVIFSCEENGVKCVYKVARRDAGKLDKEIRRIGDLARSYPSLRERLPVILKHGRFENGAYAGMDYYVQTFFPGTTFSHYVQDVSADPDRLYLNFRTVLTQLFDIAQEHEFDPSGDDRGGEFLKAAIDFETGRLNTLDAISQLRAADEIVLNGERLDGLTVVLKRIFASPRFAALDQTASFISRLGHWNFHGDNVLLADLEDARAFRVIDPDINIDACDPLFGIARFLYSFPHDSAEYRKYVIRESDPRRKGLREFEIQYLWPQRVFDNYSRLFLSIYADNPIGITEIDDRYQDATTLHRLKLCFLYCLLRGVYANYEPQTEVIKTGFRNKGTYLYLQAVRFANHLQEEWM